MHFHEDFVVVKNLKKGLSCLNTNKTGAHEDFVVVS